MILSGKSLGIKGEAAAAEHLKKHGYEIIEQNYRCRFGEIDIIGLDKGSLAFIEVKSRTSDRYGTPFEAVNYHKQKKIRQLAAYYLQAQERYMGSCRFDVVGVHLSKNGTIQKIEVIKNAF